MNVTNKGFRKPNQSAQSSFDIGPLQLAKMVDANLSKKGGIYSIWYLIDSTGLND